MKSVKKTKASAGGSQRWYDDACASALALELIGERWALLILRELMFGPRRFGELKAGLSGISANVLTQRLEGLEAEGLLTRHKLPPPASVQVYELTPWGYESEPIFQTLGRWAIRSPRHDPTLPLSTASLLLSLRTMLHRERAARMEASIGFRIGEETFLARLEAHGLEIRRGPTDGADVLFESDTATLAAVIYGGQPLAEAEAAGTLVLQGDRALARRFVTLFPLPAKAAVEPQPAEKPGGTR